MSQDRILLFIPTYNERENIETIYLKIKRLNLGTDFLFLDDNSPDGTGRIINELARGDKAVFTIHRAGKLGIGSAHQEGIRWAYGRGYNTLVTMDCDLTHQPEDIRKFLEASATNDVVVGSRYMDPKSLADWNPLRKFLTYLGHFLTERLLRLPYDASGAFRLYRLDRIPAGLFDRVRSGSYSFFFESLYLLALNGFRIREIPILLPKRNYGHSKMKITDGLASFRLLTSIWWRHLLHPKDYLYAKSISETPADKKRRETETGRLLE